MKFYEIEKKHEGLIDIAKKYMSTIEDCEHDMNHMYDVVEYVKSILENLNENIDVEVCIIGAYWHDVGRINGKEGHEKTSAEMLKNEMIKRHYEKDFIDKCVSAIEFHKWNMNPKTIEGLVLQDADKIAWIGTRRWKNCLENNQRLDSIMRLLEKLRNEILHFDYSKSLYDQEIIKLVNILYQKIYPI